MWASVRVVVHIKREWTWFATLVYTCHTARIYFVWPGCSAAAIGVAPLRMEVWRGAPGSQVLPDFEVTNCPRRAASADQGSHLSLFWDRDAEIFLFESRSNRDFAVPGDFAVSQRFCWFEIRTEKSLRLFPKRDSDRLPWSAEAALLGLFIISNSGRTWLLGTALLIPILNGATLLIWGVVGSATWFWQSRCLENGG